MTTSRIDTRLLGTWYSKDYNPREFSFKSQGRLIMGPGRRFVDMLQFLDSTHYDPDGDWKGWDTFCATLSLENRGFWNTDDSTLHLYWDDNRYIKYKYEYDRSALILKTKTNQTQLWTRRKEMKAVVIS